jgi:hypothetical protein
MVFQVISLFFSVFLHILDLVDSNSVVVFTVIVSPSVYDARIHLETPFIHVGFFQSHSFLFFYLFVDVTSNFSVREGAFWIRFGVADGLFEGLARQVVDGGVVADLKGVDQSSSLYPLLCFLADIAKTGCFVTFIFQFLVFFVVFQF